MVGGVIFLIITIVQFLVIAKGSECVAEVSARFTLDAMPGKQMSIDADLRAGTIGMEEARARRVTVEKKSQLYGAMDGAMKFVKGDAIAGLIVTGVNIMGGIAIGVLQQDMSAAEALQTFSVLTIGDGLISQIPALFISITAGIIVTRVTTQDSSHLGGDIGNQVLSQPKALAIGGVILLGFTLIPGFPKIQFLFLGLLVGGTGFSLLGRSRRNAVSEDSDLSSLAKATGKSETASGREGEDFALTVPLLIDVAGELKNSIHAGTLNEELGRLRRALYMDLGVPFPGIHLRFNEDMPKGTYTIQLQEIPISEGRLKPGHLFVREQTENLDIIGISYETDAPFLPRLATVWLDDQQREALTNAGISFMEPTRILTYHLSFILKKHADDFIGLQETKSLLDRMEDQYAMRVKEVQRLLPLSKIMEVFQRLVQEEISIRNLRAILQSLIEWAQKEKDVVLLTEYVRMGLARHISYKYSGGLNMLASYMLDPDVEETIRKAIRQTSSGSYLALDPETSRRIVAAVKQEVGDVSNASQHPVLLTSMDIRRYVKKLIQAEMTTLPVLSYQELTPEITVQFNFSPTQSTPSSTTSHPQSPSASNQGDLQMPTHPPAPPTTSSSSSNPNFGSSPLHSNNSLQSTSSSSTTPHQVHGSRQIAPSSISISRESAADLAITARKR